VAVSLGIGVPRTTLGGLKVGGIGRAPSAALEVDGPSRGLGSPWRTGARPRNTAGVAGGCELLMGTSACAFRRGGVN